MPPLSTFQLSRFWVLGQSTFTCELPTSRPEFHLDRQF
jgi:hypothetical protein